jgi:hypothetical protein
MLASREGWMADMASFVRRGRVEVEREEEGRGEGRECPTSEFRATSINSPSKLVHDGDFFVRTRARRGWRKGERKAYVSSRP